jgi:putative aldouronate transport system permease protein
MDSVEHSEKRSENFFQFWINAALSIIAVLMVIPFVIALSVSFSNESDIVQNGYNIFPRVFDLTAYRYVFQNNVAIIQAYQVTVFTSVVSTLSGTLFMAMLAYPLSQKAFRGRRFINLMVYLTMLFNGGLVPIYILNTRYLQLNNTIWIYIIPLLINPWYVFLMRTFFIRIPEEIHESAVIDGIGEFRFLFTMLLPLSKPVLAAVALFTFLARWNEWFQALLYIDEERLFSLQFLLQRMINNVRLLQQLSTFQGIPMGTIRLPQETVRMAMAVVAAGPALLVFPFFQRYFVKGLTVGSIKG